MTEEVTFADSRMPSYAAHPHPYAFITENNPLRKYTHWPWTWQLRAWHEQPWTLEEWELGTRAANWQDGRLGSRPKHWPYVRDFPMEPSRAPEGLCICGDWVLAAATRSDGKPKAVFRTGFAKHAIDKDMDPALQEEVGLAIREGSLIHYFTMAPSRGARS